MEDLKKYDIELSKLKEQEYQYQFESKEDFFDIFKNDIVQEANFQTNLKLIKSSTMIQLFFSIQGTLRLTCDRSLEEFDYPFHTEQRQILKFGQYYEEQSEDLEVIPWKTIKINIAKYIYEFVVLAVPSKRLHPKFQEEEKTEEEENVVLVYQSEEEIAEESSEITESLEENLLKLQEKWNKKKQK